jgi:class 3 adenylate cyclase
MYTSTKMDRHELNIRLFHAVARGDLTQTKSLIAQGADLTAVDYNGKTCIDIAESRNLAEMISLLKLSGAEDTYSKGSPRRTRVQCSTGDDETQNRVHTRALAKRPLSRCASIFGQHKSNDRTTNAHTVILAHFPSTVAASMLQGRSVAPTYKQSVSIFFSDIDDYSSLRGSLDPPVLLDMLERLFHKLDRLAALHGVERIDAVDGCYIAAANFSRHQPADHASRLALFAVAAVAAATTTPIDPARPSLGGVRLRAGAHCGAVCGGLLGAHGGRKHTLVGDAVNVASRMQSQGAAGAAQCSAAFAAAIAAQGGAAGVRLDARAGGVDVRGRGHMEAFWMAAAEPQAEARDAAGGSKRPVDEMHADLHVHERPAGPGPIAWK